MTTAFATLTGQSRDYARVAAALRRLTGGASADLTAAAGAAGLSPAHFHRMFRRWAGVSPQQFAAQLTLVELKRRMADGESVLNAAFAAGLSGGARAHDLFVAHDAMTPGAFRRRGQNSALRFGRAPTPYGPALVVLSEHGVCALRFLPPDHSDDSGRAAAAAAVGRDYPRAELRRDDPAAGRAAADIFHNNGAASPLAVRGTNFQVNVWRALLAIPPGQAASYRALAAALGKPGAARAVGRAAAANPVACLIPCHRVIGECGNLRGYAWGETRKQIILAREFAARPAAATPL